MRDEGKGEESEEDIENERMRMSQRLLEGWKKTMRDEREGEESEVEIENERIRMSRRL